MRQIVLGALKSVHISMREELVFFLDSYFDKAEYAPFSIFLFNLHSNERR